MILHSATTISMLRNINTLKATFLVAVNQGGFRRRPPSSSREAWVATPNPSGRTISDSPLPQEAVMRSSPLHLLSAQVKPPMEKWRATQPRTKRFQPFPVCRTNPHLWVALNPPSDYYYINMSEYQELDSSLSSIGSLRALFHASASARSLFACISFNPSTFNSLNGEF